MNADRLMTYLSVFLPTIFLSLFPRTLGLFSPSAVELAISEIAAVILR